MRVGSSHKLVFSFIREFVSQNNVLTSLGSEPVVSVTLSHQVSRRCRRTGDFFEVDKWCNFQVADKKSKTYWTVQLEYEPVFEALVSFWHSVWSLNCLIPRSVHHVKWEMHKWNLRRLKKKTEKSHVENSSDNDTVGVARWRPKELYKRVIKILELRSRYETLRFIFDWTGCPGLWLWFLWGQRSR